MARRWADCIDIVQSIITVDIVTGVQCLDLETDMVITWSMESISTTQGSNTIDQNFLVAKETIESPLWPKKP